VGGTSDKVGHLGLLEDVLFGFAMFRATTRRDKCRRIVGHVGNKFAEANGVRPESSLVRGCMRRLGVGQSGVDWVGLWGNVLRRLVIRTIRDGRIDGKARAEARGVFLEDDIDGSGGNTSFRDVHTVPWGVKRVANHDAAKRIFTEFPM
jgi:hypothetical protein